MKLSDSVQYLKGVGPRMKEKLERLGIHTVEDLLSYFPRRYQDWTKVTPMGDLVPDEEAVVYGEVVGLKEIHPRRSMSILNVMIVDDTGAVVLTYFNQPWKADLFIVRSMCWHMARWSMATTGTRSAMRRSRPSSQRTCRPFKSSSLYTD